MALKQGAPKAPSFKDRIIDEIGDRDIDEVMAEYRQKVADLKPGIQMAQAEEGKFDNEISAAHKALGVSSQHARDAVARKAVAFKKYNAIKGILKLDGRSKTRRDLLQQKKNIETEIALLQSEKAEREAKEKERTTREAERKEQEEESRSKKPRGEAGAGECRVRRDVLAEMDSTYRELANYVDQKPTSSKTFLEYIKKMAATMPGMIMVEEMVKSCQETEVSLRTQPAHKAIGENAMVCAIVMFTFDLSSIKVPAPPPEANFRFKFNARLRARDPVFLKKAHGYLYYFLTGLSRLPPAQGHVFMGVSADKKEAALSKMPVGQTMHFSAFSSTTTKRSIAASFAGTGGILLKFRLLSENSKSRDIHALSAIKAENEILLLANFRCTVTDHTIDPKTGFLVIDMAEKKEERVQVDY